MRNIDKRSRSLAQGLSIELRDAELRDDVMDVPARGDYAGSGFQLRNDA